MTIFNIPPTATHFSGDLSGECEFYRLDDSGCDKWEQWDHIIELWLHIDKRPNFCERIPEKHRPVKRSITISRDVQGYIRGTESFTVDAYSVEEAIKLGGECELDIVRNDLERGEWEES